MAAEPITISSGEGSSEPFASDGVALAVVGHYSISSIPIVSDQTGSGAGHAVDASLASVSSLAGSDEEMDVEQRQRQVQIQRQLLDNERQSLQLQLQAEGLRRKPVRATRSAAPSRVSGAAQVKRPKHTADGCWVWVTSRWYRWYHTGS
ncbi:MAG: hypothetical protein GY772_07700, partial [bacterium]|nr:hypothetical protein [bacterium]